MYIQNKEVFMNRDKIIIKTSFIGIIFNIILVIFKMIVGLIVGSIAIILDGVNNLTDTISSISTIIGTKIAAKSPDYNHPYGHGRVEYFTSIFISFLIILLGLVSIKESVIKIINPTSTNYTFIALLVIAVASLSKLIYGKYVKKIGKSINSGSLIAVSLDAFMDALLTLSTLIAGILNMLFKINIEGYLGIIISIVIIRSGVSIFKEAMDIIIGKRFDKKYTDKIKKFINSYSEVINVCDLSLHNYGPNKTVGNVHVVIMDNVKASDIHALERKISVDIYNRFDIFMTIGIYAYNSDDKSKKINEYLKNIIKEYSSIKQIHGFYVDYKNSTIYFDLIIDFDCSNKVDVKNIIIDKMKLKYPKYEFSVIIDDDISD